MHHVQTPNFAMVSADVPWIEQGHIPYNWTTLQYMEPPMGRGFVPPWDIQADWSHADLPPPSSVLLDFMYGAAVVKHWKCNHLGHMLEKQFKDGFSKVLAEHPKCSTPKEDKSEVVPNDSKVSSDASAGLLEAMDDVLLLLMLLKGTTPQLMAAEWEKQNKEKELCSREHSGEKVQQWLDASVSAFIKCLFLG
jgi:hypothetical protein